MTLWMLLLAISGTSAIAAGLFEGVRAGVVGILAGLFIGCAVGLAALVGGYKALNLVQDRYLPETTEGSKAILITSLVYVALVAWILSSGLATSALVKLFLNYIKGQ